MNDIFHRMYEAYVYWAGNLPEDKLVMLVRLSLLFIVPTAILSWTFANARRTGSARLLLCLVADGVVLAIPLAVPSDASARAWILALASGALAYLPSTLPFYMVPEAGRQRRLRKWLYGAAAFLLIIGLIWS